MPGTIKSRRGRRTLGGAHRVRGTLRFLGRFAKNPATIGAIAPSSVGLARMITSWARLSDADVVVEYGPGTGAFTPHILHRLKPRATFFALELDQRMADACRRRFPDVAVYCDSAANVGTYLARHGAARADCIVCGLPWAAFRSRLQDELMAATLDALSDGGQFVTFAYLQGLLLPTGQRFQHRLRDCFSHVSRSPVVWRNLPPAFVYQCMK